MNLTYTKLRKVIGVIVKNPKLKAAVSKLNGKMTELSFGDMLELVYDSNADMEILNILTDGEAESLCADAAFEAFRDFFTSMSGSLEKLKGLLPGSESAGKVAEATGSNGSK